MPVEAKKFLEATKELKGETEVRMGTKNHHHSGEIFFDGYNFDFFIDWSEVSSCNLTDLRNLVSEIGERADEDAEILSRDVDDLNTFSFVGFEEVEGAVVLIHD